MRCCEDLTRMTCYHGVRPEAACVAAAVKELQVVQVPAAVDARENWSKMELQHVWMSDMWTVSLALSPRTFLEVCQCLSIVSTVFVLDQYAAVGSFSLPTGHRLH